MHCSRKAARHDTDIKESLNIPTRAMPTNRAAKPTVVVLPNLPSKKLVKAAQNARTALESKSGTIKNVRENLVVHLQGAPDGGTGRVIALGPSCCTISVSWPSGKRDEIVADMEDLFPGIELAYPLDIAPVAEAPPDTPCRSPRVSFCIHVCDGLWQLRKALLLNLIH